MKQKKRIITLLFCLFFLISLAAAGQANPKPTLAVLDLALDNVGIVEGSVVYEYIIYNIYRSNAFSIIERAALDKIIAELELSVSGIIDDNTVRQIGSISDAAFVLTASLSRIDEMYYLSMRLVVTETGETKRRTIKSTNNFEDIESLTSAAVKDLFKTELQSYGEKRQEATLLIGISVGITLSEILFSFSEISAFDLIMGSMGVRMALLFPLAQGRLYTGINFFGGGYSASEFAPPTTSIEKLSFEFIATLSGGYIHDFSDSFHIFCMAEGGISLCQLSIIDHSFVGLMGYYNLKAGAGFKFWNVIGLDLALAFDILPFPDTCLFTIRPLIEFNILR